MSSVKPNAVVISGTGLYTPEHVITNEELVDAYNRWTNQYNAEHATEIEKGQLEAKPRSSVEFIVKASGIRQRFAYVKEGILDIKRMRPLIPERPEEALSDQAEMALHAAKDAIKAAGKRLRTSMRSWSHVPIRSAPIRPLPLKCKTNWG